MAKGLDERQKKFVELVASGKSPYRACIEAGYSEQYAKAFSGKLLEKYKNEIEALKPVVQEAIKEEFKYTVKDSFNNMQELKKIALNCFDKNGNPNINAAIKAEELMGKMYGVYKADNEQKLLNTNPIEVQILKWSFIINICRC